MSTCNWLDLQTLGSQLIMPKNLPDHWANPIRIMEFDCLFNHATCMFPQCVYRGFVDELVVAYPKWKDIKHSTMSNHELWGQWREGSIVYECTSRTNCVLMILGMAIKKKATFNVCLPCINNASNWRRLPQKLVNDLAVCMLCTSIHFICLIIVLHW